MNIHGENPVKSNKNLTRNRGKSQATIQLKSYGKDYFGPSKKRLTLPSSYRIIEP